ncbi:bifunctional 4-hydroxy-2-oxoglutarate aldolase/2-dehydro-3-deoxy-phosphogluconate aldolase [Spirosoma sp. BT702]|uniref:Bifunctional 4-hydroxy-2-oxoglutarate aldolase/2-dehydro-3-deoxy-phosphogluconate aldolase n=1 Tax=Spirosoma profusum TaxID=2771354 RepID=A0A926Y0N9_9BACT|nr:bifunctional 4-hydroxy-2-oxoglutarate aldolase/2-dehydro-3-deoxy-phosphogluconate aldolase [Spirosoma profusum]MBD2703726.1 bifunctional 4-hydroxy-2-oxoglutarate aldolase/2-dehydro-3-deoxy-phosphogluconate aldolase [Spirosoma profusum]
MPAFSSDTILDLVTNHPIVPVFYHADAAHAQSIVQACYDGGLRVFEFTNRGDRALPVFTQLAGYVAKNCPDMALGIGTILTPEDATKFIEAGAAFVVQPVTTAAVGDVCREKGVPWMPAGSTLNEIYQATLLGARLVKVFPGNVVGPDFIKAIKGPMPWLQLMVTGGVEPTYESINAWFKAGVTAVGMGSQLFAGDGANPDVLRERVDSLVQIVRPFISKAK